MAKARSISGTRATVRLSSLYGQLTMRGAIARPTTAPAMMPRMAFRGWSRAGPMRLPICQPARPSAAHPMILCATLAFIIVLWELTINQVF